MVDSPFALQLDCASTKQDFFRGENEMTGSRLARLVAIALSMAAPCLSLPSHAEDYPARSVRIIVPFGAGGPADVAARLLGNVLQDSLGQPFVIENRTGAGGVIGTQEAA